MKLRRPAQLRNRKGQALVEYGILIGGVALVCLAAVAILGHKSNDLIGISAAVLPAAHTEGEGAIVSGRLVATEQVAFDADGDTGNAIRLNVNDPGSMGGNMGLDQVALEGLVVEPEYITP